MPPKQRSESHISDAVVTAAITDDPLLVAESAMNENEPSTADVSAGVQSKPVVLEVEDDAAAPDLESRTAKPQYSAVNVGTLVATYKELFQ